ncbi:MAG: single-stranded DNA-binding protein [Deltaproteobacteria bacterium]|nr:single-stranded DNA-binding protein [Deltaproteobacteria bacterium]
MNQVNIIGRLGGDVELRYTPSSKAVSRMSVAVNERYGQNERVYWFPVICWSGLAETVSSYLHKGSRVAVSGRLTTRSYETDDGSRTVTEIVANSVYFLDPKPANQEPKVEESSIPDDDIPF